MASNDEGLTPFQDAMLSEGFIDTSPEASNDDVRGVAVYQVSHDAAPLTLTQEPNPAPGDPDVTHVAHSLAPEAQAARREAVEAAIDEAWADYYAKRRDASQRIFGHPGAHIGNLVRPDNIAISLRVLGLST